MSNINALCTGLISFGYQEMSTGHCQVESHEVTGFGSKKYTVGRKATVCMVESNIRGKTKTNPKAEEHHCGFIFGNENG